MSASYPVRIISDEVDTVRVMVYDILRRCAADGRSMVDAFAHIPDVRQDGDPVTAPLDGWSSPF